MCPDRSDHSYCLHKVFTGCIANTSLGYKIVDCNTCFCDMRDQRSGAKRQGLMYSTTSQGSQNHLVAKICMERTNSKLFCDGVEDCLNGEDEDGELCYKKEDVRKVQTNNVDIHEEEKEISDFVETDDVKTDGTFDMEYLDVTIIIVIFFITCVTVVGVCFIIILVMYKVVKTKKKSRFHQLLSPSLTNNNSHDLLDSWSTATVSTRSPPEQHNKKPTWSLRTTSIVKELGQGFYSKVYLAQDIKNGFVALKTVDNQRNANSEECINNEIDILANVGAHLNIVKVLG